MSQGTGRKHVPTTQGASTCQQHRAQARANNTGRKHVIRFNGSYYEVAEARGPEPVGHLFIEFVRPESEVAA